jgi:hypothetical protein
MSMDALAFLRLILPTKGLFASWTKQAGGRSYNRHFENPEALCASILADDQRGHAAYHACATFSDPRGVWNDRKRKCECRCHANVHRVRALWLDVDCGKPGAYPDAATAAHAVAAFCRALQLPTPLLVASGSGLHVYWPLVEELPLAQWEQLAQALKVAAATHGLLTDPSRTADASSVLRTPGTHNRKQGDARQVFTGPAAAAHRASDLRGVLGSSAVSAGAFSVRGSETFSQQTFRAQALIVNDAPPAYSEAVADGCAHIAALRETRGNLPEPLWYACLGVLAWCQDGERFAHAWSSGHPAYSAAETTGKLQRCKELTTGSARRASTGGGSRAQFLLAQVRSLLRRNRRHQRALRLPSHRPR